jgi:exosome complex RNA-binding protein Csl4
MSTKYITCPKCKKEGVYISGEKVACNECGYTETLKSIVEKRLRG